MKSLKDIVGSPTSDVVADSAGCKIFYRSVTVCIAYTIVVAMIKLIIYLVAIGTPLLQVIVTTKHS